MTNLKTPAEISAEMFNRVMKEFEKNWNSHPINDEAEQQFLKWEANRQTHLADALSCVRFDLQKGTLIRIDLGPEDSEARSKWKLSAYRPEGLQEGDILMYAGWFQRSVKVFGDTGSTKVNSVSMDKGRVVLDKEEVAPKEDKDLSEAFSTKIQLFIRAGKEEVWAGLIPDFYYVTLIEGSGGLCDQPLFVQEQGLTLNKDLIAKIVGDGKKLEALHKVQQEPAKVVPKLVPEVQQKQLRKEVRKKYDEEYQKADEEAKQRWEASRGELEKLSKALSGAPVKLK